MGKQQSAPPPPDYAGAAQATAAGNADAARIAAKANRVSQYTPYGNLVYTSGVGGDPDQWKSEVQLAPAQQQLLEQQNQTSLGLAGLQNQGLGYVKNMLDQPFDTSKLPAQMVNPGQTAQDAIMSRLDPSFTRRQSGLETQLANQGIARGTEAWKAAQTDLDQARNDAYTQAALQGMGIGQQARQQALQEQAYLRNEPLNTLNAVRTGSQVTGPQFQNVPQQATTQGADLLGATQAQYGAQLGGVNAANASNNAMMQGLFNLGSAYMLSDRRLKTDIKQVGKLDNGLNVYQYRYVFGGPTQIGVMADEVERVIPDAVATHASGYKLVDYSRVM
jgi:enamine deaminase RidA (YjgF/YER057c/UK114 family)